MKKNVLYPTFLVTPEIVSVVLILYIIVSIFQGCKCGRQLLLEILNVYTVVVTAVIVLTSSPVSHGAGTPVGAGELGLCIFC